MTRDHRPLLRAWATLPTELCALARGLQEVTGEHESIIERLLFEAVQAKLAAGANARTLKLRGSPSILTGRIFDQHGTRMTPTHTNKDGARYRYYVSHRILQKRNGSEKELMRVPAQEIEALVIEAVREHLAGRPPTLEHSPTEISSSEMSSGSH